MGIQTQSALIAAVLLLALAINVALQERRVEHRRSFTALVGAFFFYNLAFFLHQVAPGPFWQRMLLLSGVVVAQACLLFFGRYLAQSMQPARTLTSLGSAVVVVLLVTRLGESLLVGVLTASLAVGAYGFGVWKLHGRYRSADSPVEAQRLLYLVIGGIVAVFFSGLDLLPRLGVPVPAVGHLANTLYLFLWMQVVQRSRLLDLKEVLGRGLNLLVIALAVALIYFTLVVWVGDRLGLFFFNTLLASVVLFFTFEPLKRLIERWVGRLLFRETWELESQLARLRHDLASVINLADLVDTVLARLQASRRITHASVFLLEDGGHGYFPAGQVGQSALKRLGVVRHRAFLDAVSHEKVLTIEQVERELLDLGEEAADSPERARLEDVLEVMDQIEAGVCFAFLSGERLLGFLSVKDDRTREAYSSFEIKLVGDLTAQITTVIENSELFERLKERDRLSFIGEMATGMAHEIRNPLGAIKAAGQLLDPAELGEEQREFVEVIIEESNRLNAVLDQFLDYARPLRSKLSPLDLNPVIERVATLVRAEERDHPVEVAVRIEPDLPRVMGDADQLVQVCLNLARNACQAMEERGGTLTLETRRKMEATPGQPGAVTERVEVRVSDTGAGIPPEVLPSLFVPFFTTKRHGTGLGLAISQRLLEHHGSSIRVQSEIGRGTTMSFTLEPATAEAQLTGEHRRRLAAETAESR